MEHSVSDELTERISESLGHPATCPHGLPIPGNYPETDIAQLFSLANVKEGANVRIVRLSEPAEEDVELLRYFEDKQLVPGRTMTAREVTPSGHMVMELDGATVVVDNHVASNLWVMDA